MGKKSEREKLDERIEQMEYETAMDQAMLDANKKLLTDLKQIRLTRYGDGNAERDTD